MQIPRHIAYKETSIKYAHSEHCLTQLGGSSGISKREPLTGISKREPLTGISKREPLTRISKREPLTGISKGESLKQFLEGSSGFQNRIRCYTVIQDFKERKPKF